MTDNTSPVTSIVGWDIPACSAVSAGHRCAENPEQYSGDIGDRARPDRDIQPRKRQCLAVKDDVVDAAEYACRTMSR